MIAYLIIAVFVVLIATDIAKQKRGEDGSVVANSLHAVALVAGVVILAGSLLIAATRWVDEGFSPNIVSQRDGAEYVGWHLKTWKFTGRSKFIRGQQVSAFRGHTHTYQASIDPKEVQGLQQKILDFWKVEGGLVSFDPPRTTPDYPDWFPRSGGGLIAMQHRSYSFRGWVLLDPKTGDVFFADVN